MYSPHPKSSTAGRTMTARRRLGCHATTAIRAATTNPTTGETAIAASNPASSGASQRTRRVESVTGSEVPALISASPVAVTANAARRFQVRATMTSDPSAATNEIHNAAQTWRCGVH